MTTTIKQYIQVIIGNILFAFGFYLFLAPCNVNPGGLIGVAQIFDFLLKPINPWASTFDLTGILNVVLNVPLYVLAYKKISKSFFFKTFVGVTVQMLVLSLLPIRTTWIMPDVLSNCIFGAIMGGVGVGLTLQASSCAGGIDILGAYFARVKPNFSVGGLSIALNACIFMACALLFDLQSALFSIIFVLLMYFISDRVHYQNINIMAMIFTSNENLKNKIMSGTRRGLTYWNGKGAFSNEEKYILVCAMNKYEIRLLNKIIKKEDPQAFVILSEGQKISGGFEKRL